MFTLKIYYRFHPGKASSSLKAHIRMTGVKATQKPLHVVKDCTLQQLEPRKRILKYQDTAPGSSAHALVNTWEGMTQHVIRHNKNSHNQACHSMQN